MFVFRAAIGIIGVECFAGCGREDPKQAGGVGGEPLRATSAAGAAVTPLDYEQGEALYRTYCGPCHGERRAGSTQGPPLVHVIYEPSHHADAAFYRAAQFGVRAHHWGFGNMAPVEGVTRRDVQRIVSYVRWLQSEGRIGVRQR